MGFNRADVQRRPGMASEKQSAADDQRRTERSSKNRSASPSGGSIGRRGEVSGDDDGPERRDDGTVSRRKFQKLVGAGLGAGLGGASLAATASTPARAAPDPTRGATPVTDADFDRTVDAVDDLGADPSGNEPADHVFSQVSPGTKVVFPSGTYLFTQENLVSGAGAFGFEGRGDVTFTVPQGFNQEFADFVPSKLLFRNIDIDIRKDNTVTGMTVVTADAFLVEDVRVLGRGTHSGGSTTRAFAAGVQSADGLGVFRRVVAREGSGWSRLKGGNGREFCFVSLSNRGTVRFEDCQVEEFGDTGIYGSGAGGAIQVIGGQYWNNNVASIRLSGAGCVVKDATIGVDSNRYSGPRDSEGTGFNTRGIWIEQKNSALDTPGNVHVTNCDFLMRNVVSSAGAIVGRPNGGGAVIRNCRFLQDHNRSAILAFAPGSTRAHPKPPAPHDYTIENVQITATTSWPAVDVRGREAVLRNSCVDAPGAVAAGSVRTENVSRGGCQQPNAGGAVNAQGGASQPSGDADAASEQEAEPDDEGQGSNDDGSEPDEEEPEANEEDPDGEDGTDQ